MSNRGIKKNNYGKIIWKIKRNKKKLILCHETDNNITDRTSMKQYIKSIIIKIIINNNNK